MDEYQSRLMQMRFELMRDAMRRNSFVDAAIQEVRQAMEFIASEPKTSSLQDKLFALHGDRT